VVYFVRVHRAVFWMLTVYSKSEAASIPAHILRKIREELEND